MKWFQHCSFCDLQPKFNSPDDYDYIFHHVIDPQLKEHQPHCVFGKLLRAATWSPNGVVVALDNRRYHL